MPKKEIDNFFSLYDVGIKNQGKVQIFTEAALDERDEVIPFPVQMSIVSHYWSLRDKVAPAILDTYEDRALNLIDGWLNILHEEVVLVHENALQYNLFQPLENVPFQTPEQPLFTFIDLFAGIGGFRIPMQNLGGACVVSSEFDSNAQRTYLHNFGEVPFGDITRESTKGYIPNDFDVLCAGFPCQAFSVAGHRRGFEDARGTLFFDVAEIIRRKRPKAVFLENVKNLKSHDEGRTFEVITNTLQDLGYVVFHKIMNSMEYANVPQNRERIFIVCFDPDQVPNYHEFSFPERVELTKNIHDCIDLGVTDAKYFYTKKMNHYDELVSGITDPNSVYQWRRQYVRQNKSSVCPTLTANMGTGGHNVPLILTQKGIRKLTPKECLNFQGYPQEYQFPTSLADSAKYKQAGNSVVVPLIQRVCERIVKVIG